MVDKVVVVVVMKSRGGENHSFVFWYGEGKEVQVDEFYTTGG